MDKKLSKELLALRKKIDAADRDLIAALSARFKVVERVGKLKVTHGLPIVQKARWAELVEDRVKQANHKNVGEEFTRAVLKLIHKEAVRIQKRKSS